VGEQLGRLLEFVAGFVNRRYELIGELVEGVLPAGETIFDRAGHESDEFVAELPDGCLFQ